MRVSQHIIDTAKPPTPLIKSWGRPKIRLDSISASGSLESAPSYTDAAGETSERSSLGHEMQAVCRNHIELTPDVAASTASFNMVFVAVIVALTDPVNQVILPVRGILITTTDVPHHLFEPSQGWGLARYFRPSVLIFCVPGYRLGATIIVLDSLPICASRPVQLALASTLPGLRSFVRGDANMALRGVILHSWSILSKEGTQRKIVRRRGQKKVPLQCLWNSSQPGPPSKKTRARWIRFSVAKVDDEMIAQMCRRLSEIERQFGWGLD